MDFAEWIKTDDALGHYTSLESAFKILQSHSFRFSFVSEALDPSERALGHFYFGESSNSRENVKTRHSVPEAIDALQTTLKQYSDNSQIACFCQGLFKKYPWHTDCIKTCFANYHMWEQYGFKFFGVCLLFSKAELINSLIKSKVVYKTGSVEYKANLRSRFDRLRINIDSYYESADKKEYLDDCKNRFDNDLLGKDSDYEPEREFRLLIHSDEQFYLDIRNAIKGIAFFYEYDRKQLTQIVKNSMRFLGLEISEQSVARYSESFEEKVNKEHSSLCLLANEMQLSVLRLFSDETGIKYWLPETWQALRDVDFAKEA